MQVRHFNRLFTRFNRKNTTGKGLLRTSLTLWNVSSSRGHLPCCPMVFQTHRYSRQTAPPNCLRRTGARGCRGVLGNAEQLHESGKGSAGRGIRRQRKTAASLRPLTPCETTFSALRMRLFAWQSNVFGVADETSHAVGFAFAVSPRFPFVWVFVFLAIRFCMRYLFRLY